MSRGTPSLSRGWCVGEGRHERYAFKSGTQGESRPRGSDGAWSLRHWLSLRSRALPLELGSARLRSGAGPRLSGPRRSVARRGPGSTSQVGPGPGGPPEVWRTSGALAAQRGGAGPARIARGPSSRPGSALSRPRAWPAPGGLQGWGEPCAHLEPRQLRCVCARWGAGRVYNASPTWRSGVLAVPVGEQELGCPRPSPGLAHDLASAEPRLFLVWGRGTGVRLESRAAQAAGVCLAAPGEELGALGLGSGSHPGTATSPRATPPRPACTAPRSCHLRAAPPAPQPRAKPAFPAAPSCWTCPEAWPWIWGLPC